MQRKCPKSRLNAKTPKIEEVNKKEAHRDGPNNQKDQNRASSKAQGRDCLGPKIESATGAMEQEARHHQDYPARESVHLVAETQRYEIYLRNTLARLQTLRAGTQLSLKLTESDESVARNIAKLAKRLQKQM